VAAQTLTPLALASVLALALTAFGPSTHQEMPRHTDALIVCPGAESVNWVRFEGTDQLGYQVKVECPADSIISCISKTLDENGWQPLREDFWNPGLPSSHVRGWTQFTDATVHPEATVDHGRANGRIKRVMWPGTSCNTGIRRRTGTLFLSTLVSYPRTEQRTSRRFRRFGNSKPKCAGR
jgi:hypothetical protein